jgi:hypothetical protein
MAGCGQSSEETSPDLSADEVADRYGYVDRGDGLTPVFVLVPEFHDPSDGYARDLLARQCLAGVIEYQAVPPDQLQSPTEDKRTGQPRFDEQIAAQYGYHLADFSDTAVLDPVTVTESVRSKMEACGRETDARLGNLPGGPLEGILDAGWDAIAGDATVRRAEQTWRACMEPVGLIDLPASPQEMPPASLLPPPAFDANGIATDSPSTVATQAERDIAVADARCRAESGYTDAVLQARSRGELEAIGADIEGFEAARAAYTEYQKGVDAVIAELG